MKLCGLVIMQDLSAAKVYDSPLMYYLGCAGSTRRGTISVGRWYEFGAAIMDQEKHICERNNPAV